MYNGEVGKGVVFLLLAIVSAVLISAFIGCVTSPIIWLVAIFDAASTASRMNQQLRQSASTAAAVVVGTRQ
jgi:TM2 domain-containing membrane protein YozV